jgi:hypothetical protein
MRNGTSQNLSNTQKPLVKIEKTPAVSHFADDVQKSLLKQLSNEKGTQDTEMTKRV